jgi:hypothetical protein
MRAVTPPASGPPLRAHLGVCNKRSRDARHIFNALALLRGRRGHPVVGLLECGIEVGGRGVLFATELLLELFAAVLHGGDRHSERLRGASEQKRRRHMSAWDHVPWRRMREAGPHLEQLGRERRFERVRG